MIQRILKLLKCDIDFYFKLAKESRIRFLLVYVLLNIFYSILLFFFQNKFSDKVLVDVIENFPFSFLTGPFVYFYCREEIIHSPKFNRKDLLHFLPLVIYIFYVFANNIVVKDFTINFKSDIEFFTIATDSFLFVIRVFQIFVYFSLGLLICYNRFGLGNVPESRITIFAPFFILYLSIIFLALYPHSYFIILSYFDFRYNFLVSLLIVFITGVVIRLFVWRYPVIVEAVNVSIQSRFKDEVSRIKELTLSHQQVELYSHLINEYLKTKPFVQCGFNKYHLISSIGLPEYLVNCYFNQHLGVSFSSWKTFQRIQESRELIKSGFLQTKTIESLAKEVGFSSRSRFVEAFRKQMNYSPTDYHLTFFPNN